MNKGIYDTLKKILPNAISWIYGTINKILSNVISRPYFAEFYTAISIFLVILTIFVTGIDYFLSDFYLIQPYIDSIDFWSKFLFFTLFFNLIFSTLTLIDQTQRIEILIYPLRFRIKDCGKFYGIRDLMNEDEINIEVFFLKKGSSKITLDSVVMKFPTYWNLNLLNRSFLAPYTNAAVKSNDESTKINPNEIIEIDKEIDGLSANIYRFRLCDKKDYTLTSENFVVTIYYTIHILFFNLPIKKQVTAKIGDMF